MRPLYVLAQDGGTTGSADGTASVDFFSVLVDFLFNPASSDLSTHALGYLIFAVACAIVGFLVVGADLALTKSTGSDSLLGLVYTTFWRIVSVFLFWVVGAGVVGYVAAASSIVQLTGFASITVAIAWTVLLPRIIASRRSEVGEDEQG